MHVVVLGSQRSGTSMVTRMLNICGHYIGQPAETPVFNQSNPRGYWEHVGFCAVNEKVLRQLHGSFENPPDVLEGWEVDPSLDELYDEARALISRTFAGQDNWGWKIPKTVLTLPFSKRVVPDLKVVVCVRNPLDYGSSINAYRNVGRAHALQLWEYYNITALMYTVPAERHIVFYEDFFPDFHNALDPLLDFVGLRRVVVGSQTDKKIADFHDEALKHHNSNIDDLISAQDVSDLTKRLYCEMRGGPPDGSQVAVIARSGGDHSHSACTRSRKRSGI